MSGSIGYLGLGRSKQEAQTHFQSAVVNEPIAGHAFTSKDEVPIGGRVVFSQSDASVCWFLGVTRHTGDFDLVVVNAFDRPGFYPPTFAIES